MELWIETIGWIGSIEILLAYGLNSYQKIRSDSWSFYALNVTGALLLILYTLYKEAYASTFINVAWVIIAMIGMARPFLKKKNKSDKPTP